MWSGHGSDPIKTSPNTNITPELFGLDVRNVQLNIFSSVERALIIFDTRVEYGCSIFNIHW